MVKYFHYANDERDETIERLRRELEKSRFAFIEMMPDELRTYS